GRWVPVRGRDLDGKRRHQLRLVRDLSRVAANLLRRQTGAARRGYPRRRGSADVPGGHDGLLSHRQPAIRIRGRCPPERVRPYQLQHALRRRSDALRFDVIGIVQTRFVRSGDTNGATDAPANPAGSRRAFRWLRAHVCCAQAFIAADGCADPPDLLWRAAAKVVETSTNERAASLILAVSREHMDVYRWRPRGSRRALPRGRLRGPGHTILTRVHRLRRRSPISGRSAYRQSLPLGLGPNPYWDLERNESHRQWRG